MNQTTKQHLTLCAVAGLMFGASQTVHAHAGFKDQITEGTVNTWNAVTVTHGCNTNVGGEDNGKPHKDVIAFSAIFPNSPSFDNVVIRKSTGTVAAQTGDCIGYTSQEKASCPAGTVGNEEVLDDLSNDIVGANTKASAKAPLPLAISVLSVGNIFTNTIPIADSNGNLRGWQSWAGPKPFNGPHLLESAKKEDGSDINTTGLAPFRVNKFQFAPASCAKKLVVRVAVANWCGKGAKAAKSPADNVDVWIGSQTTKFSDQATMPNAAATGSDRGAIFWPGLTINRDLVNNPLPNTCTNADYDTVYIEPAAADIDNLLPIAKAKYPAGAGTKYWPVE